ncbi:hypothetical protein ACFZC6_01955 [Streptomyces ossamyceticus]|uniref:hypothetical protein n=1 Tax=Streptomyces ossamyceticus TaxID=249581 RepID=UPI0036E99BD3
MTAVQLTLDDPEPCTDPPTDRHPTPFDRWQHEMRDLRGQAAGPHALRAAETVPTQEKYL